jgi:glutathione synthase/RimK-type ligase-like ATP-grasp enzyme
MKLKAIILRNELEDDHNLWIKACEAYNNEIEYRVVNLTSNVWLDEIQKCSFDILLAKPGGLTAPFKQLYDERIYILAYILRYKIFPSPLEIFIYENKRVLSYWLKANNISHPETFVFYNLEEMPDFVKHAEFPMVAKTNIGASGSGVKIIKSKRNAFKYIKETFSGKGSYQRTGPNTAKGEYFKRGTHYLFHPSDIGKKLDIYRTRAASLQKGFVIFQEYIPHEFEWRVVRIGESFFAHKKFKRGEKASGALIKIYENPPFELLDFVKEITGRHEFYSQAVDIFESNRGYLVNEMQCIFGQSDPYQMLVDGKPGRYKFYANGWIFESGDFAVNECYNLRLDYILNGFFTTKQQRREEEINNKTS